jgi:hypothetical protein
MLAITATPKCWRSRPEKLTASKRAVGSHDHDRDGLDCVAAVAETIPFGLLGLRAASQVGRSCPHGAAALCRNVALGEQFPPLPAVPAGFAGQLCRLTRTLADGEVDPFDRSSARPGNAAHDKFIACQ